MGKKKTNNSHLTKPTRKGQNLFFETLTTNLPGLYPKTLTEKPISTIEGESPEWINQEALDNLISDAKALGRDAWFMTKKIARAAVGKPARRIYYWLFVASVSATCMLGLSFIDNTYAKYAGFISDPKALLNNQNTGTTILDRNGKTLFQVYGASTRVQVETSDVPKSLINATLAAEDPKFYEQTAISIRGTARAIYKNILHRGAVEGGSTLTQQLIKNTLVAPEGNLLRKAQEVILANELENQYTKDEIMGMYLNGIYYGQGSYGVGAAAQIYFNTDVQHLSLSQSAMLAGLPLGPSRFDPTQDPNLAKARRNFVLDRMQSLGFISVAEEEAAKSEPLTAFPRQINIEAPSFVFYVLDQLRDQYGDDVIKTGGLTVYTTLDLTKQTLAEKTVSSQISRLTNRHVTNGALVSLDPKTGEVLAMVGSANYNDPNFGAINMTTALRQPGSSIKPLVYITAFNKGYTPATIVDDLPVTYRSATEVYQPNNYDMKWRGKITIREALGNSLNIPAIHVLEHAGIPDTLNTMHTLGITTMRKDPASYGLSMALGSGEVKMLDLAAAYGVFANRGKSVTPVAVQKVLDRNGKDMTKKPTATSRQLIDPRHVAMLTSVLSDDNARKLEFGLNSPLHLSRPAAAKTGTTTDFRDNWTAGYTPDVVTVTWAGNADNSPMSNVDGITGAAPIWHDYMEAVLAGTPVSPFEQPSGMTSVKLCKRDGGLANPWDANTVTELVPNELIPTKKCSSSPPPPPPPPTTPTPEPKIEDNKPIPPENSGSINSPNQNPADCKKFFCAP